MLIQARGFMPKLDPTVFLAEGAKVIGDVELAAGVSIWFNAVVRGDVMPIKIGMHTFANTTTYWTFSALQGQRICRP